VHGTAGGSTQDQILQLDLSDRPYVLYTSPVATAVRLCVAACPAAAGNATTAAQQGFCLTPSMIASMSSELLSASGVGSTDGCPAVLEASVPVLQRCTPLSLTVPVEGVWVDIVAAAIEAWPEAAVVMLLALLLPPLIVCQRRLSAMALSVASALLCGAAALYLISHAAHVDGSESHMSWTHSSFSSV
jgi:hypothetical protein